MRGFAVVLAAALLANTALAEASEAIRIRAGLHAAYGRLVFDWRDKVGYDVRVDGDQLVVTFDRPFTSSLSAAEKQLAGYIGAGVRSEDGRTITFPLRRPIAPTTFVLKQSVVVDLYHSSPPGPVWRERTVPSAAVVNVRGGEHPTHTRFVFDWPQAVDYQVTGSGRDTLLAFGKPARLDTDGLGRKFARLIDAGGEDAPDIVSAVRFSVPDGGEVRHFRLGNRVVVDLVKGSGAEPAVAAASAAERAEPVRRRDAAEAEQSPERAPQDADPVGDDSGGPAAGVREAVAEAPKPTPPETATAERPESATDVASRALPEPVQIAPQASIAHRPTGSEYAQAATGPAAAGEKIVSQTVAAVPRGQESTRTSKAAGASQRPVVDVGFARKGDGFSLSFPGLGDTRASVFGRAGAAWVVFDKPADLRLAGLKRAAPDLARGAAVLEHPSATVLRLEERAGGLIARREGAAWVVDFGGTNRPPYRPLSVATEPAAAPSAGLVIAVDGPGEPLAIVDPEAGDRLIVVPLAAPDTGLAEEQEYPEVRLLATAQGVAAVQHGDGLLVSADPERIKISTGAGLLLSRMPAVAALQPIEPPGDAEGPQAPTTVAAAAIDRLLDLARWQRSGESFNEVRQELEQAVLEADEGKSAAARLELARFYLARGLAAEALGSMEAGGAEIAAIAGAGGFHAMRGAANLLTHRLGAAEADLSHADLEESAEADLWRGALHARRGEWGEAARLFEIGWGVAEGYPKWLRQELGMRAAEAALDQGGGEQAARYLAAAVVEDAPEVVMSRARFLEGRLLAEKGNILDALAVWSTVSGSADQLAHAKAELAAVKLGLQERVIGLDEAIERLERLRFAWRGDALEFETLSLLGRSYLAAEDYWNGFSTLRGAVTLFSDTLDTAPATELMTAEFRRLFVDGEVRELPPLKAVSLYEEFRELTPIGEEGDRVIRDLAARLVNLDLLEPAAELLDNQVRYRLDGERRARTGADLALILLLDRKPSEAVDALRKSAVEGLPGEVAARRRHLLARGLWEMGEPDQALGTLASDQSREADALRADIYWKAGRWAEAARTYGRMGSAIKPEALSAADGRLVLKWGVTLALAKDSAGLRRMADTYGKAMTETPHEAAFRMITAGRPASGASLATITETLTDVGDFQDYLKGYRNALEKSAALAPSTDGSAS